MTARAAAGGPTIPQLIQLTLAALVGVSGCGSDDIIATTVDSLGDSFDDCGDLGPIRDELDVSAWDLSPEGFAAMLDQIGQFEVTWDGLDDQQKCELTCAYASAELAAYFDSYPQELEIDKCTLTLLVDQDSMFLGGTVTCAGAVVTYQQCLGRRPLTWLDAAASLTGQRDQLAEMAIMEQISITAFGELAAQLEQLAAPAQLVERCRAAARDEQDHVALLVELGAAKPLVAPEPAAPGTSRLEIARHNATEGCVAETWAALLARYQSGHAATPATRRVFAQLAEDEGRHAQLAWDLHTWLCAGLSPVEAAEVEAARAEALRALASTSMKQALAVSSRDRQALGLPDPRTARALAEGFGRRLAAVA